MRMNRIAIALLLMTGSLGAADSSPKEDVTKAAKKLGEAANYSWTSTVENAGGGQFRGGPTSGMADKDGNVHLSMTRGDNKVEAVVNGKKGAIKMQDDWKSLSEAAEDDGGGQPNMGRFVARMLQNYRTPATEAAELASMTKDLKKEGDSYSGTLTEAAVKELLSFRGRAPGGEGPQISDAKGTVKFWMNDGVLSKYEHHVQGKVSFNGNDRDVNRTTTTEIKNVGKTKVEIPDAAKKKMS